MVFLKASLTGLSKRLRQQITKRVSSILKRAALDELIPSSQNHSSMMRKPTYLGTRLYYRGMTAFRMKDYSRAAKLLREALDYRHTRKIAAEARYHLATSHDRLGERRTARELYNRFVQRHSKHPYAAQAKRRHNQLSKRRRR